MEEENQTSCRVKKIFELRSSEGTTATATPLTKSLFRLPAIPKEIKHLALQSRQKSKKVLINTTVSQSPQQMPSIPTEEAPSIPRKIAPARVTGWKLREQLVAFRRLKALKKLEASNTHRIKPMEKQHPEINEQAEYWKEVVRSKQERHFSMNRIIKYLSE
ncbi:MAG TPA: hypothetical protein VIJ46_06120 [Rhabdochlamydiaceae bacterium]